MVSGINKVDEERRLDVYLGCVRSVSSATYIVDEGIRGFISHPEQSLEDFTRSLECYEFGNNWKQKASDTLIKRKFRKYIEPIQALYKTTQHKTPFLVLAHDNTKGFSVPTLTKSANIAEWLSNRCILPLTRNRHWDVIKKVDGSDRNFHEKDDKLVWRGATTGTFRSKNGLDEYSSRYFVAKRKELSSKYDIGFTFISLTEKDKSDIESADLQGLLKNRLDIRQQLQSKYLLSLEGNDVASGLKWMLYSRSVVIMPKPRCESWHLERFLSPFRHYVPVKQDLSDIDEVYQWCLNNTSKCEEIAMNGRAFIVSLLNEAREDRLARRVVDEYASKVSFDFRGSTKKVFD